MVDYTQTPPVFDSNIVFFDTPVLYSNEEKNNLDFLESEKLENNVNIFSNNTLKINLYTGFNSTFTKNQIINSDFFKEDEVVKSNIITPFDDSETYLGKKVSVSMNPIKKVKTLGLDNPDTLFEDLANKPFEETENLENIEEYFEIPNSLKYPRFFNTYAISRLNSNISVFGTIDIIDGSSLTIIPLQGLKVQISNNGNDARGRNASIRSNVSLDENNLQSDNKIEFFLDNEVTDLPTNNQDLLTGDYSYTLTTFNGTTYVSFRSGENENTDIARLTNAVYYYTEDNLKILPFDDTRINRTNEEYSDTDIYSSTGQDTNNSAGTLPQSIAYAGDID